MTPRLPAIVRRKTRKLLRDPQQFMRDSSGYRAALDSWQRALRLGSFLWVLGCFALISLYCGWLSSDRYVSQAQVIVKQAEQVKMASDALSLLGIGGSSHQDALVIQSYLASWPLYQRLDQALQLQAHFQQPHIDWLSRLAADASREDQLEHYLQHLTVSLDEISGVLSISFQAYDPAFAHTVVQQMVKESELFINRIGHQVAQEQLQFVEREVQQAHHRLQQEQQVLLEFQRQYQLLSPDATSSAMQGMVAQLDAELVRQQTELKRLERYMQPAAPDVVALQDRIAALQQQLQQEQTRLTGQQEAPLNEVNARYQALQVQAQLAADLYKTGLVSLEQARVEAYRKLKHLLLIAPPGQADDAEYPRRLYNIATAGVLLCLLYGLLLMGLATLREHKD